MEQKQNVKQTTIEDQIELIWNENPKIPFMQSKEILVYGYKKGIASVVNKISDNINTCTSEAQNIKSKSDEGSFTGTTKEFFEHTEKEVEKRKQIEAKKDKSKTVYIKASELDIEEARFKLLDELYNFISDKRDLMDTYTKVKNMRTTSQKQLKALKNKYKSDE